MTTLVLYRKTTIGQTLLDTLDEMMKKNLITHELSEKILEKFDQVIQKFLLPSFVKNVLINR